MVWSSWNPRNLHFGYLCTFNITGTRVFWETSIFSRDTSWYPSRIFVIFWDASNCLATKSSSFFILVYLSTFFFSCCKTIFLTFIALPQYYLFTCLRIYKDCFLIFFSSSLFFCSLICSSLLHVFWLNFAIFLFNLILYSLSEAKSFPASSTCLNKYFHLFGADGSSIFIIRFPNCS